MADDDPRRATIRAILPVIIRYASKLYVNRRAGVRTSASRGEDGLPAAVLGPWSIRVMPSPLSWPPSKTCLRHT